MAMRQSQRPKTIPIVMLNELPADSLPPTRDSLSCSSSSSSLGASPSESSICKHWESTPYRSSMNLSPSAMILDKATWASRLRELHFSRDFRREPASKTGQKHEL